MCDPGARGDRVREEPDAVGDVQVEGDGEQGLEAFVAGDEDDDAEARGLEEHERVDDVVLDGGREADEYIIPILAGNKI